MYVFNSYTQMKLIPCSANIDKQEAISTAKLGETIYVGIGSDLYSQLLEAKWRSVKEVMNDFGCAISTVTTSAPTFTFFTSLVSPKRRLLRIVSGISSFRRRSST